MAKKSTPTGKAGRSERPWRQPGQGVKASSLCCVCSGTGRFRFRTGEVVECTNCGGRGRQF